MRYLPSIFVAAVFVAASSSAYACPGMNKVSDGLESYTGNKVTATQSPTLPDTEKKLIVNIKKPAKESAN